MCIEKNVRFVRSHFHALTTTPTVSPTQRNLSRTCYKQQQTSDNTSTMTIKTILQPRSANYQRLSTTISPGKLTKLKRSRKSLVSTLSTLFPTNHLPQKIVEVKTSTTTTPVEHNQTDHPPQEIMKVKELKNWLQDFGEKNTEHFRRSRDHRSPNKENEEEDSLVLSSKPSTTTTSSSSSQDSKSPREELDTRFCHRSHGNLPAETSPVNATPTSSCDENYYPPTHIPSKDYDSELTRDKIKTNASGPITVTPSCSCSCDEAEAEITSIKENTSSDPTETTTDETEDANELYPVVTQSWDSENNVGGSWDFSEANFSDESNVAQFEDSDHDYDDFDDFDSSSLGTGRLSEPRSSQPNPIDYQRRCTFGGIQGMDNMGNDHVELLRSQNPVGKLLNVENDDSGDIHLLDKETNPSSTMHNANIFGNKTLTSSTLDFICNNGQVDKSKQAKFNETTIDLSDEGTASSASQDSAQPSIAPDAMDSKLVRQFLNANDDISQVTARPAKADTATNHSAQPSIARVTRKKLDPKDLPFLQHKPVTKSVPLPPQMQSPKTAVGLGIRKYGGPRKTIVERRKEQLEKKWSESKSAKHVTKIKWGVCHKTGTYKKKVVLDVQY
jgi:hypothetical protein